MYDRQKQAHPRHSTSPSCCEAVSGIWARSAVTLSLVAALVGCGGGGSPAPASNPEIVTVQAGVALYDGVAGFFRMLNLVGVESLTGQAEQKTTACPGGGSIVSNKLATPVPTLVSSIFTVFTLTANQCRFMASDGLVYQGTWNAEGDVAASTYSTSGVCPSATCNAGRLTIRTEQARYGYGIATDLPPAMPLDLSSTPTSHTFNVFFSGSPITTGSPFLAVFGGNQQNTLPTVSGRLVFDVSLTTIDPARGPLGQLVAVRGNRETLLITAPFRATVTFADTNVVAAVDRDNNGTVDVTYTIPWRDFLETN